LLESRRGGERAVGSSGVGALPMGEDIGVGEEDAGVGEGVAQGGRGERWGGRRSRRGGGRRTLGWMRAPPPAREAAMATSSRENEERRKHCGGKRWKAFIRPGVLIVSLSKKKQCWSFSSVQSNVLCSTKST